MASQLDGELAGKLAKIDLLCLFLFKFVHFFIDILTDFYSLSHLTKIGYQFLPLTVPLDEKLVKNHMWFIYWCLFKFRWPIFDLKLSLIQLSFFIQFSLWYFIFFLFWLGPISLNQFQFSMSTNSNGLGNGWNWWDFFRKTGWILFCVNHWKLGPSINDCRLSRFHPPTPVDLWPSVSLLPFHFNFDIFFLFWFITPLFDSLYLHEHKYRQTPVNKWIDKSRNWVLFSESKSENAFFDESKRGRWVREGVRAAI